MSNEEPTCPNCRRIYQDCDAYLRDEGVEHGVPASEFCQRGARLTVVKS